MSTRGKGKGRKKTVEFLLPGENQVIGIITKGIGNGHYLVYVPEKGEINCRMRGSLTRQRVSQNSVVIIEEYLNINNIIYIYPDAFHKDLKEMGLLPKISVQIDGTIEEDEKEETYNFDNI